ncbi:hypothetical protein L917_04701 [Phytophthora nicotianae]|uniref:Uncharacterized protein n=1 Tax=Phytophthora nicotianae TaxID=4792 RepID=W2LL27_PHYNI|nr:hypothetical protein L917_04701 [Phytophthora nicotianae]
MGHFVPIRAKLPILFIIRGGAGDRIEKNKLN